MAKLYHDTQPMFGLDKTVQDKWNAGQFLFVAEVDANSLEDIFRLTNHIDSNWTENKEIKLAENVERCRSTSVGDIVELNGKFFLCENLGWTEVELQKRRN